ncbi:MAG: SprT-like domain-containing protein [Solitalea-like symbiont of Tyrophagus putrescentiae]
MIKILSQYLPASTVNIIYSWIQNYKVHFIITPKRNSKKGDYTPLCKTSAYKHRISVNGSLNKWAFLITTIHEFAHLINWEKYGSSVMPHGKEWKQEYKKLMQMFFVNNIFPLDIYKALVKYMVNPKASTSSDLDLMRSLYKYNLDRAACLIDDLPIQSLFMYQGRKFKKIEQMQKKYRCMDVNKKDYYLFHPTAEVEVL